MLQELPKAYDASSVEGEIYQKWLESGYFNPDQLPNAENREPYTIILPPLNVTGTLHMGHAYEDTIQDVLIRFKRMQGFKTLWLPGTDHAAIATQAKVEKDIYSKEGKSRYDLGRVEFLRRVNDFAQESHDVIVLQLKKMGASVDWSREAYTLDTIRNYAVRFAFQKFYDLGLVYRGLRVVNWDPKGQTTISDDEIVYEERKAKLYTFKYAKDFPISISTTRPETKVGDTAVAVHPADARYMEFIGKEYDLEFCGTQLHLKIVADESVDPSFGTGALGVTPAHSQIDWEIAQKNNLPLRQVIDERAKMMNVGENLLGKKTLEAREIVVDWLKAEGLLEKEEEVLHNISLSERTRSVIEPLPKEQWFMNVDKEFVLPYSEIVGIDSGEKVTLKRLMRYVVETGQVKIFPNNFEKIYYHWIDNLRDWCISRQIWFGHRIPVWYCSEENSSQDLNCNSPIISLNDIETCPSCGGSVRQDEDTFDTWFSSGLWTFTTLGWPTDTTDLKVFHPTDVINPGYEILQLWVARMILMSTTLVGQIPFRTAFIHGLVRDKLGRKFSKSLNNGIDPQDMIAKYGTDALRFALVFSSAPGHDIAFDEEKIKGMKHFANKVWNIARFIMTNLSSAGVTSESLGVDDQKSSFWGSPEPLTEADKDILGKLEILSHDVTAHLEGFRLHEASQALYHFIWREFADVYIESAKGQLQEESLRKNTLAVLIFTLTSSLKLLHPFMPFLTEYIWKLLLEAQGKTFQKEDLLIVQKW